LGRSLNILADVHELPSGVPGRLAALGVEVESGALAAGDYCVARGVLVERKSVLDLHDSLDMDLRYDLARIAEVTGALPLASAQTDTILAKNPNHLLGLGMAARLARARGNSQRADQLDRRLLAAEQSELALGREEYRLHKTDVDSALARARRGGGKAAARTGG